MFDENQPHLNFTISYPYSYAFLDLDFFPSLKILKPPKNNKVVVIKTDWNINLAISVTVLLLLFLKFLII